MSRAEKRKNRIRLRQCEFERDRYHAEPCLQSPLRIAIGSMYDAWTATESRWQPALKARSPKVRGPPAGNHQRTTAQPSWAMCTKLPLSPIRRRLSKPLSGAPECSTHRPFEGRKCFASPAGSKKNSPGPKQENRAQRRCNMNMNLIPQDRFF